jgi:hypothetical protein
MKNQWLRYEKAIRENDRGFLFEFCVNEIIGAGFPIPNPFFTLFDCDGEFWPRAPHEMSAGDIYEYVEHRFGPLFVGYLRTRTDLTEH